MMLLPGKAWLTYGRICCLLLAVYVIVDKTSSQTPFQLPLKVDHCSRSYYTDPACIDHPEGYGCECGPGFHWNTHTCMSSAIDSRFEFRANGTIRYALLLSKAFPKLTAFTIAFWINVTNPKHEGTIFSYKYANDSNVIRMSSGPKLNFQIRNQTAVTDIELIKERWYHIALTYTLNQKWVLYIDGHRTKEDVIRGQESFPSGGEFILGRNSRSEQATMNPKPLDGDLSHLNIWNYVMTAEQIKYISSSCTFMYCGNAVQWVEFRSGTRGATKMRWPSGIFTTKCFDSVYSAVSCNTFCSRTIGAQCKQETKENIKWAREKAQQNVSVLCPMIPNGGGNTSNSRHATRSCELDATDNDGSWGEPNIDDCISRDLLELKKKFIECESGAVNEIDVLRLADRLLNHTNENVYLNPIDIATVIDLLAILVKTQNSSLQSPAMGIAPRTVTWKTVGETYATTNELYPTFQQTTTFCEILINIVNNLLAPRNEAGWNATSPSGTEGDQLLQVMRYFAEVVSRSLDYHIIDFLVDYRDAKLKVILDYVEFKIETQWVYELRSVEFPDSSMLDTNGRPAREAGFVKASKEAISATNASSLTVFIGISTFRYKTLARMLPTHDVNDVTSRHKEDRVNTPIVALYFHMKPLTDELSVDVGNLSHPIYAHLPIIDTFNISNPHCVRLRHSTVHKQWKWYRSSCTLVRFSAHIGVCACKRPGVYAITTDMYDDNWDKGDKRPKLMNFASYFGCTMSAMLCLMVCGVHIYLRTSTSTAAIHRNLSVSIALSQLVFMFGIERYETPALCHIFAIALHYFFLSNYSWVMNEAFNLYIVITYSAHNPSDLNDSGSMIRYYILGWVLPAIMVGAFVGTSDDYYAKDMCVFYLASDDSTPALQILHMLGCGHTMTASVVALLCWVAPDHMWLFIGPAIGIMSITILVLIFTAKEHNENSYTKSDKTNKIINIHMKALWTQVILVTVCWAFAFISIKMVDTILKYLYAMFTSLQGAFFLVFYMFLHEEVRAWIKGRQKRRALQLKGFEYQDNHSLDSFASNSLIDRDVIDSHSCGTGTIGGGSGSGNLSVTGSGSGTKGGGSAGEEGGNHLHKDTRPPRLRELSRWKNRPRIEATSEESSDCEMISSV